MEIQAAVTNEKGAPFTIETVELEEPQDNEVLVRVVGAGVCHTDMIVRDQMYPTPLPAVLGHEGSGVVEQVGDNVTNVEPGDRVVLSFDSDQECTSCNAGHPAYCEDFFAHNFGGRRPEDGTSPLSRDGEAISGRFFGQSSFATHAIATERNVVAVEDDVPLELLGPLGCGIQTGAGAVINTLDPQAGDSIAIFGAGSVGLSALLGADIKGCTDIVSIDLKENRLEKATTWWRRSARRPVAASTTLSSPRASPTWPNRRSRRSPSGANWRSSVHRRSAPVRATTSTTSSSTADR
jgi:aryl-alcohol dehydrogenase